MRLQSYPVGEMLETYHPGGLEELKQIARELGEERFHDGLHSTSREDTSNGPVYRPFIVVPPAVLHDAAPWMENFYKGLLLKIAKEFGGDDVVASENLDNYPLINIHPRVSRLIEANSGGAEETVDPRLGSYEWHIDSNPFTGAMFLGNADRTPQTGGALVVYRNGDAYSTEIREADCDRYYAKIGNFTVMQGIADDGEGIAHCVEPSFDTDRIMWIANWWNARIPESARAAELANYQIGEALPSIKG